MSEAQQAQQYLVLQCRDSLEGIFTGIYEAYACRRPLNTIMIETTEQDNLRLFTTYQNVIPDSDKAAKVVRTLKERLGGEDYHTLCMALSSPARDKAQAVFKTVVWGLKEKKCRSIMEHLTDNDIRRVLELSRGANNELLHLKGFLRFQELENDVLFSTICPANDILPLLAMHFSDRLPKENFVIFDEGRKLYVIHPSGKEWFMMRDEMDASTVQTLDISEEEKYYQKLFTHFCHTISIEAKENYKLQRNMLPIHFRKYMVEFSSKG